ncbi:MAG TPA: cytochrome d ubiquinol oxidase subunit II, partial [Bauldia sp.]|nr:cytochrome d ubiquinol oxidase subunit II [Bauldia sp.]
MEMYLPDIWAILIAVAVVMYVVLDGFDLGIGILLPFRKSQADRDLTVDTVAPFWDGNETWLVLGGGGLWVAFPQAYAVIMPANYLPIIVMLLALIFRGVSFEFRVVSRPGHRWWDIAFAAGSIIAAFAQGVVLGSLIQGITVVDGAFAGGPFDWLSPFSLLCGVGVVAGYALLGATWLIARTEGTIQAESRAHARVLLVLVLGFIAAVSLWTPLAVDRISERWFSTPNIWFLWPVPIVTGLVALLIGALTLRLRADYLAITTFGVAIAIQLFALNAQSITGAPFGIAFIPRPFASLQGDALAFNLANLATVAAVTLIVYVALERLVRGPWGRVLRSIREDEAAAAAIDKSANHF